MFKLVLAPDNRLRVKTKPVKKFSDKYKNIIKEMVKLTKTFIEPEGVGLASTQIGLDGQYFIAKSERRDKRLIAKKEDRSFVAVFNPKILSYSKKTKQVFEGCLSIPNFWGELVRPVGVTVSYQDGDGNEHTEKLTGLDAHIFQHEYDHLQGKLFMDLLMEQKGRLFKIVGKDKTGADVFEEVTL